MSDLVKRLRLKAAVMSMGERIAWGSDTELMLEGADRIEVLEKEIAELCETVSILTQHIEKLHNKILGKAIRCEK